MPFIGHAAGSVTLNWTASPDSNVVGYNLYYGGSSTVYSNMVFAGNATSVVVSGLATGVAYYFAATAVDGAGDESDYSNEVSNSIPVVVLNQPPTLDALPNLTINENAGIQTINLTGINSGFANGTPTLVVSAVSDNPGLINNPNVNYASPNTTGSISFKPAANASGSANITVIVNNGAAANNLITQSFLVNVTAVNQPPTISSISNRSVLLGVQIPVAAFTVSDVETPAANLTVTGASSNPALVQNSGIVFGGAGANRIVTIFPVTGQAGSTSITITVSDGSLTASSVFKITVVAKPTPPNNLHIAGQ